MAKKQFLKLRRLAEDQDITTDELAAKAGIVPRTLRKRFAAQDADERAHRKVHKEPQNTVKGKRKVG